MNDHEGARDEGFCPHGLPAGVGCSSCEERLAEWRICQRRGHQPSGQGWTMGFNSWSECKWCGTSYRIETTRTVQEDNKPYGADDE